MVSTVIGDLDDDGIPEIVCVRDQGTTNVTSGTNATMSTGLLVYDGQTHALKANITMPSYLSLYDASAYGLVKTFGRKGLIIVATVDDTLRAYDITSPTPDVPYWTSDEKYGNSPNTYLDFGVNIGFADFNHDGYPEIYVRNKIFDAETGKLLKTATGGTNTGSSYAHWTHNSTHWMLSSPTVADVTGDGNLNLILGNEIYDVNIVSRTDTTQNSVTMVKTITPPDGIIADGHAEAVDFDNDGHLDILITNRNTWTNSGTVSMYVWDVFRNTVSANPLKINVINSGKNIPLIADVDNDRQLEIVLQCANQVNSPFIGVPAKSFICYKYNTVTQSFSYLWAITPNEDSFSNGITLFDFNQDGTNEILFTDQANIRIYNANQTGNMTNNYLVSLGYGGTTVMQIPLIADVDNDGASEIIISSNGTVTIFKSLYEPWAPSRPVWNQYMYNPVYINDDLTVPAYPLNPATPFVTKNDSIVYPFNNFLQQATLLNSEGIPFSYGSDITFDTSRGTSLTGVDYTSSGNDYIANVWITNEGDATFTSPLTVSAYIMQAGVFVRVFTGEFTVNIPVNNSTVLPTITFTIPGVASLGITNPDTQIQLRLNELDNTFIKDECRYSNNFFPSGMYGAPNQVICEGNDERLDFYPQNSNFTYVWYDNTLTAPVGTGDYLDITKDGTAVQSYYVRVYENGAWVNEFESTHGDQVGYYQVDAYLYSDSLIWTGNGGTPDWHNPQNWLNPNTSSPSYAYPQAWIPRPCTHVLIPDGLDVYPNLDLSNTSRTIYAQSWCDHIHFEFGGEVARTDSLHYTKAWIQYNFGYFDASGTSTDNPGYETTKPTSLMERDQWYALSAPLNKIVTGDFSLGGKPHTWQKRFVRSDAQTGTFTGNFDWPDDTILPNNEAELNEDLGYAIALLVADHNPGYNGEDWSGGYQAGLDTLKGIITIPYFEGPYDENDFDNSSSHIHPHRVHKYDTGSKTSYFKEYWYYVPDVPLTDHPQGSIQRENEAYRFIFDGKMEQIPNGALAGKNAFKITVPTGKEIMLGNPFMSSFKFNNFYLANSAAINNYFRLYNGTFNTYEYNVGSASITDTIAVLQAFFITTTGTPGSTVDLYFPFETTSITRETGKAHDDYFKSPKANNDVIYVTATSQANKNKTTSATLALNEEGQNVYQLFYEAANTIPQVYFTDESGQKNAVQYSTENENQATTTIPLGLRSGFGNRVTLTFDINADVEALTLLDKKTGQTQDLLQNNSYTFTQSDNTTPYIDRFEVSFKSPMAISEIKSENKIAIYQDNEIVTVSSSEKINSVELFDMQGRKVKQADKIENNVYQMNLRRGVARNAPTGVYIVKVVSGNGETQTHKIIVK
ncbi:hypothetical protein AGMMS50262_05790 [Bacteroidia bacterium]|nr:hypothetical protein AGMMS50262_05790 [Bacteroidia bacterium]